MLLFILNAIGVQTGKSKSTIINSKISIKYHCDINALVSMGLKEAKHYDGTFEGDSETGKFNFRALGGQFVGYYTVNNDIIEIVFNKKPLFVPINLIESFLKIYIR